MKTPKTVSDGARRSRASGTSLRRLTPKPSASSGTAVVAAARATSGADPLGGLRVEQVHVVGVGHQGEAVALGRRVYVGVDAGGDGRAVGRLAHQQLLVAQVLPHPQRDPEAGLALVGEA